MGDDRIEVNEYFQEKNKIMEKDKNI